MKRVQLLLLLGGLAACGGVGPADALFGDAPPPPPGLCPQAEGEDCGENPADNAVIEIDDGGAEQIRSTVLLPPLPIERRTP